MIEPKKCCHNPRLLCGIVKNVKNCPYTTDEVCKATNSEAWLGLYNPSFKAITLKRFRYNHKKIKLSVLDENMCSECRVIWASPQECPICKGE